ncbi:MAG: caspase domain-containing protein [Lautropia sp.]
MNTVSVPHDSTLADGIAGALPQRRRLVRGIAASLAGASVLGPLAAPRPALAGRVMVPERRSALVFGNADYPTATLRNPVRDARLVTSTLKELGFKVSLAENASLATMRESLRDWLIASANHDVRAFYYAGHGVQYRGSSFLIPVDAVFEAEDEIVAKAFNLQDLIGRLSRTERGVNFVILDACRADPKALLTQVTRRTRSLENPPEPGFAPVPAPRGTVIAYSTSPGALAADGRNATNSVFTRVLAEQMRKPGVPIETVFKRVRMAVMRETRNAQVPWETSSLVGDFCMRPNAAGECGIDG